MDPFKKALERAAEERAQALSVRPEVDSEPVMQSWQEPVPSMSFSGGRQSLPLHGGRMAIWANSDRPLTARESAARNAYEVLATKLVHQLQETNHRSFMVTSASAAEGKTHIASHVSMALAAAQPNPVVLVDLNLRRPSVHRYFATPGAYGVIDVLKGRCRVEDVGYAIGHTGVSILPGRESEEDLRDFAFGNQVVPFVYELERRLINHVIVFDMPAILNFSDVISMTRQVPHFLLVNQYGKTTSGLVNAALNRLADGVLLGCVLNKSREYTTDIT